MRLIFFVILTAVVYCCKDLPSNTHASAKAISIAIDRSDPRVLRCDPVPILQLFDCVNQPDSEGWLQITGISDQLYNQEFTMHLLQGSVTAQQGNEDPQARKRYIIGFYDSVQRAVTNFYNTFDTAENNNHSEIFATICRQVHWLQTKPGNKILLIFSDLLELSNVANSYTAAIPNHIPSLVKTFNNTGMLPDRLPGYTVYVVNIPRTRAEDARYAVMAEVYRQLFEERGAKFLVQTNNQNFTP